MQSFVRRFFRPRMEVLESRQLLSATTCGDSTVISACSNAVVRRGDTFELAIALEPAATEVDALVVDWGDGRVDSISPPDAAVLHTYRVHGPQSISVTAFSDQQTIDSVTVAIDVVAGSQPVNHYANRGLAAELYANVSAVATQLPTTLADHKRVDPTINFDFGFDAADPAVPPIDFGIRWTGTIEPSATSLHTFHALTGDTDSLRVWVDGQLVIDSWDVPSGELQSGDALLTVNVSVPIKVEFRAGTGRSKIQLRWESPLTLNELLPSNRLTPAVGFATNGALIEEWDAVGTEVADLTALPAFVSNMPNDGQIESRLEFDDLTPTESGHRGRALLTAPSSGYYQFLLSGNSTAELWLADGTSSSNAKRIASVSVPTAFQQFGLEPSSTSEPLYLVQGEQYYIELLQKTNATVSSHASVAWLKPDDTTHELIPNDALQPIRPVVKVFADRSTTNEADGLADGAKFTVTRSDDYGRDLIVNYTIGGTAENDVDYMLLSGSVLIPQGESSASIDVLPIDDGVLEGAEDVVIRMTSSDRYWLGVESEIQATATILGEDIPGLLAFGAESVLLENIDFMGGETFSNTTTSSSSVPFTDVLQVDVASVSEIFDVQSVWVFDDSLSKNDVVSIEGYVRSNNVGASPANAVIRIESNLDFLIGDERLVTADSDWTRFFFHFVAPRDFAAGELQVGARFGFSNQSVQLGGLELSSHQRIIETQLLPDDATSLQNVTASLGDATYENIAVNDPSVSFDSALRVDVASFVNPWDVRPIWDLQSTAVQNTPMTISGYIRSGNLDGSDAIAEARVEQTIAPFDGTTFALIATDEWEPFEFEFDSLFDFSFGHSTFDIRLGFDQQVVEIADVTVTAMEYPVDLFPSDKYSYVDREALSVWREQAESNVALYRNNDLRIEVVDDLGEPVDDASISIELVKPKFQIGSTIYQDWFSPTVGTSFDEPDGARYRATTAALFQRTVDSAATQWSEWLRDPMGATEDAEWSAHRGLNHKGHSIIWGTLDEFPAPTAEVGFDLLTSYNTVLSNEGVEAAKAWMQQTLLDHINNNAAYALNGVIPDTDIPIMTEWDVINHPIDYPAIWDIVGNDFMVDVLQAARAVVHPKTNLFINEDGVVSATTNDKVIEFSTMLTELMNNGAPIDGIGLQSHFESNNLPSMSTIQSHLDQISQVGLKLHTSEFDVDSVYIDDQTQADFTRDYLLASLSEPALEAFYFWGFWEDHHWRNLETAELVTSDFLVRPNGQVLLDYLQETFTTYVSTGSQVDFNGAAGNYLVTVTRADGSQVVQHVALDDASMFLQIVAPPQGLVTHWEFEQNSALASDNAVSGLVDDVATLQTGVQFQPFAGIDGSLEFFGDSGVVVAAESVDLNASELSARSISLWFYADDVQLPQKQVLLQQGDTTSGLNIYISDGSLYAGAWNPTQPLGNWVETTVSGEAWHNVVLTFDQASSHATAEMALYLGGVEVDRIIGQGIPGTIDWSGLGNVADSTLFHDGSQVLVGAAGFDGLLDELRFFTRELSGDEIMRTEQNRRLTVESLEHRILLTGNNPDVVLIGDSTVNSNTSGSDTGWGEVFSSYVSYPVTNAAVSGSSAKTFYDTHWDPVGGGVKDTIDSNDVVLIQFGINDPSKCTNPGNAAFCETEFKDHLNMFIADVEAAGATPILVSLPAGFTYWPPDDTVPHSFLDTRGPGSGPNNYVDYTRDVATASGTPIIELFSFSVAEFQSMTIDVAWALYVADQSPGSGYDTWLSDSKCNYDSSSPNYRCIIDRTHPSVAGANIWAEFMADELEALLGTGDVDTGLVTHWDFDGDANDQATLGLQADNGTLAGASLTPGGLGGNAASFDGSGDAMTVATSPDINQSFAEKSISLWFYPLDLTSTERQVIYQQGGSSRGMNIYLEAGNLYAGAWNSSTSWTGSWLSSASVLSNQWNHVAMVLDSPNSELSLYINGTFAGSDFATTMAGHNPATLGTVMQGTKFDSGSSGAAVSYQGFVDEVRIYDRVLAANDVGLLNSVVLTDPIDVESNLVAHWDFEGNATDVAIEGVVADDGTLVGATLVDGGLGVQTAQFDGSGDVMSLASSADINTTFNSKTVALWFYAQDLSSVNRQVVYQQGGTARGMNIYLEDGSLFAGAWNNNTAWSGSWVSTSTVAEGWNHVALVLDASSSEILMYLNGSEIGTDFATTMNGHNPATLGGVLNGSRYAVSGGGTQNSGAANSFKGFVDDGRVYARVLSGLDIASLASASPVSPADIDSNLVAYWDFEGNATDKAIDGTQSDDGTLAGASIVSGGLGANALSFDNSGDIMTLATSPDINTTFSKKTISLLFNPTDASSANRQVIYQQGGTARGMNIYLQNGNIYAGAWNNGLWGGTWLSSSNVTSNQWNHVVLTFDSAAGELQLFVNGDSPQTGTVGTLAGHNAATLGTVQLGTRFHNGVGASVTYAGDVDDVRIYSRVLSTSDIDALPVL